MPTASEAVVIALDDVRRLAKMIEASAIEVEEIIPGVLSRRIAVSLLDAGVKLPPVVREDSPLEGQTSISDFL